MGLFLRRLFIALAFVLLMIGIYGYTLPKEKHVERSITINQPASVIFPMVNNLKKFNEWSPWTGIDPNTQFTFSGPDDGVGANVTWASENRAVGNGSQKIIESRPNEFVKTELNLGGGPAHAQFILQEQGDQTEVTWAFDATLDGILERYFGLLAMEKMLGDAYDQGLQTLKKQLENDD